MELEQIEEIELYVETPDEVVEFDFSQIGPQGLSAYEVWLQAGNEGTIEDYLASLKGERGIQGEIGPVGPTGPTGPVGPQGEQGIRGEDATVNGVNTINIVKGKNISLQQIDNTLVINNDYEFDDSDIQKDMNTLSDAIDEHDKDIANIDNSLIDLQDNKADKKELPDVSEFITKEVNTLLNYYLKSETYTKEEVAQLISAIKTLQIEIVDELPSEGDTNKIYLVPIEESKEQNFYYEYIYVNGNWEMIGTTEVDLSNYYNKDEINSMLNNYVTSSYLEEEKYNIVKEALVNNTNTLTDQEKLKIESWLGLAETYLTYYNETPYQVNGEYNPAHKKYVDEKDSALRERISEIELSKFPNATIIGTPTIQQGQVSNFSLTDYMEFPFLVDFRGRPFEINFAFTTGQDVDNQQNILDSDFGLAFAIRNKHLVMAISFNGTSWATEQTGTLVLQPQITYRIKITWNGLSYKVQYSMDGGNTYVDDITFGSNQSPYPKQIYIGTGKLARNFFKGIINMNYCDVSINGNKIWLGMDDAGLSLRMSVSMDNIDASGIAYINSLIDTKLGNIETELQNIDTGAGV